MKNLTITRLLLLALLCCASIPLAAVNYDTAWTFVHDGGKDSVTGSMLAVNDNFYDVKALPDGSSYCTGGSRMPDSMSGGGTDPFLVKLDKSWKLIWKKLYRNRNNGGVGHSIIVQDNGDLIIGGKRSSSPWIVKTDSSGTIKWATWYYDSIKSEQILSRVATVNAIKKTADGNILAVAGDAYP
jgi:hypothetical protein